MAESGEFVWGSGKVTVDDPVDAYVDDFAKRIKPASQNTRRC